MGRAGDALVRARTWALDLPRAEKRAMLVVADFALLSLLVWLATSLRYGALFTPDGAQVALMLAAPVITIVTFASLGLYKLVTRYMGARGMTRILMSSVLSTLIWSLLVFMSGQQGIPRSVVFTYGIAAALAITASRQVMAWLLKSAGIDTDRLGRDRKFVLIYGAGDAGQQLNDALRAVHDREVVAFVDHAPSLWGQYVGKIKVYRPERLESLIERKAVGEVLLALPESQRQERRAVLKRLEGHPVAVKLLPAMEDIARGRVAVSDLRPVEVEDLLGRDPVPPVADLMARAIRGKSILVTGAGGSVGSELVRHILRQGPRRLVLLDLSEVALYEIEAEVRETLAAPGFDGRQMEVFGVLGSVLDGALLAATIERHEVQTIYHAAAYKHVPIVEDNAVVGLENNVLGTKTMAETARRLGVERVVAISTDKAVRPTNVMGASKRLAELVLQAIAAEAPQTVFSMVRFGNVLDSSGSVVRRFRKQIGAGGPVTVTHPEVIRYFMSLAEAADLVIQAGAMARGGEVFVLDMGDPVKIDDLARLMVRLSGLEVRDTANPHGEIAITYTGLRPGEKLYEELLIGANTAPTEHPRIQRSDEPHLSSEALIRELDVLRAAMATRDSAAIRAVLMRTVEGYRPGSGEDVPPVEAASWRSGSRTLH
jgi:FlaA1/EpsC-like NDP-sugar epimerase